VTFNNDCQNNALIKSNISFDSKELSHNTKIIYISPDNFEEAAPLDSLNEKWFINLSNVDIPIKVQYILQLGEGFDLVSKNNMDRTVVEFIKHIKNNIHGRPDNIAILLEIIQ